MRRIPLPLGRRLFLLVATLAALLLTLPLRLALGALGLPAEGLSARSVEGTLWSGRLAEARLGGVPLGDLRAGVRPLPLLAARARIDLADVGDVDAAHGALTVSRHTSGIDDATLRLPVAQLFAPLPLRAVALTDVSVRFRDGICEAADGEVRAELGGDLGGAALPGAFTGSARCEAGALLLPLVSPAGAERLTLRLLGGGRYRAELSLRPADPAAAARLAALGFSTAGDGMTLAIDGAW